VRLLWWDRSGMIVTEAIKYNEFDLTEFLFYYLKAPDAMHSKDESVSVPEPAEESAAREILGLEPMVQLVKLSFPDADGTWYFVTPVPSATMYIPSGCATCGFKAYDVLQGEMAFLKDLWRIDVKGIKPEGLVYKALESAKVKHIPHCLVSGNTSTDKYHSTKTHMYIG
jgi:hypothetical protein